MLQVCPRKEANASNGLPPRTVESVNCLSFFDPILAQDAWHYSFQSLAEHKAGHSGGKIEMNCHSIFKLFKLATSQGAAHSSPATFPSITQPRKPRTSSPNHGTQCQTCTASAIVKVPISKKLQETSLLPSHKCQKLVK